GLAVDTDITFCDFTGTIEYFVKQFFGPGVKTRFRPSYFPFTEPSVEFDVSCIFCGGSGAAASGGVCSKCKGAGWIELFGPGMVISNGAKRSEKSLFDCWNWAATLVAT